MWNAGEIRGHLCCHWLKSLIEHFLQIIILPPRLRHVMIGENLPVGGGEKPSTKSIQVYFRTTPGQAQERVLMFVSLRLAIARNLGIVQSQSGCVLSEGKHNVDKADARLIRFDNRL